MGGVDRLDQNIALRSKKWCWPTFHFCVDLCANNAFQIYQHLKENPGQKPLHLLGFQRSIIDTYYQRYRKATQISMFPGSRMKAKVSDEIRFDKLNHWIGNAKQQWCAECGKKTLSFCEKCKDALHPECFFGIPWTVITREKILFLGTALCNHLADIFIIFLCCL